MYVKQTDDLFIVPITTLVDFHQSLLQRKRNKKDFDDPGVDVLVEDFDDVTGESSRIVAATVDNIVDKNAYVWTILPTPSSYKITDDPITSN